MGRGGRRGRGWNGRRNEHININLELRESILSELPSTPEHVVVVHDVLEEEEVETEQAQKQEESITEDRDSYVQVGEGMTEKLGDFDLKEVKDGVHKESTAELNEYDSKEANSSSHKDVIEDHKEDKEHPSMKEDACNSVRETCSTGDISKTLE